MAHRQYKCPDCQKLVDYSALEFHHCKQTNFDKIIPHTLDELFELIVGGDGYIAAAEAQNLSLRDWLQKEAD